MKALPRLRRLSSGVDDIAIITVSTSEAHWLRPCLSTVFAHIGDVSADAGTRRFSPPGKNGDGDPDWVLVLTAS